MVDAIPDAEASSLFSELEKATIAFTTELTRDATVSDATFERAAKHFDERQLVELVMSVAVGNMNNRISEAFWADVDEQRAAP